MSLPACHDCGRPSHGTLCSTCLDRTNRAAGRAPGQRTIHWSGLAPQGSSRLRRAASVCGLSVALVTDDYDQTTCRCCVGR